MLYILNLMLVNLQQQPVPPKNQPPQQLNLQQPRSQQLLQVKIFVEYYLIFATSTIFIILATDTTTTTEEPTTSTTETTSTTIDPLIPFNQTLADLFVNLDDAIKAVNDLISIYGSSQCFTDILSGLASAQTSTTNAQSSLGSFANDLTGAQNLVSDVQQTVASATDPAAIETCIQELLTTTSESTTTEEPTTTTSTTEEPTTTTSTTEEPTSTSTTETTTTESPFIPLYNQLNTEYGNVLAFFDGVQSLMELYGPDYPSCLNDFVADIDYIKGVINDTGNTLASLEAAGDLPGGQSIVTSITDFVALVTDTTNLDTCIESAVTTTTEETTTESTSTTETTTESTSTTIDPLIVLNQTLSEQQPLLDEMIGFIQTLLSDPSIQDNQALIDCYNELIAGIQATQQAVSDTQGFLGTAPDINSANSAVNDILALVASVTDPQSVVDCQNSATTTLSTTESTTTEDPRIALKNELTNLLSTLEAFRTSLATQTPHDPNCLQPIIDISDLTINLLNVTNVNFDALSTTDIQQSLSDSQTSYTDLQAQLAACLALTTTTTVDPMVLLLAQINEQRANLTTLLDTVSQAAQQPNDPGCFAELEVIISSTIPAMDSTIQDSSILGIASLTQNIADFQSIIDGIYSALLPDCVNQLAPSTIEESTSTTVNSNLARLPDVQALLTQWTNLLNSMDGLTASCLDSPRTDANSYKIAGDEIVTTIDTVDPSVIDLFMASSSAYDVALNDYNNCLNPPSTTTRKIYINLN